MNNCQKPIFVVRFLKRIERLIISFIIKVIFPDDSIQVIYARGWENGFVELGRIKGNLVITSTGGTVNINK